jgi:IclR family transcriptional regulator, KDG regulon repressor
VLLAAPGIREPVERRPDGAGGGVILPGRALPDPLGGSMSAATRALRVLEHLAAVSGPVGARELATATDIPRSTLSDLMAELRTLGYVEQVAGGYAPGVALTLLGYKISQRLAVPEVLHRTLQELAEGTGETALYSVELGADAQGAERVLIVDQVASPNPIRYVAQPLPPRLMTETASGRVLLAFSGREAPAGSKLSAELALAREQGYYVNVASSGATSIAAPVFDADGRLVGALTVSGPTPRMTDAESRIWPTLRAFSSSLHP